MITIALSFVMAAVPAMQVLAIAVLVNSLTGAQGLDDVRVPLLWVVLIVGLSGPVRVSCANLRAMAMARSGAALQTRLARRIARMHPSELVKPATTTALDEPTSAIDAEAE